MPSRPGKFVADSVWSETPLDCSFKVSTAYLEESIEPWILSTG